MSSDERSKRRMHKRLMAMVLSAILAVEPLGTAFAEQAAQELNGTGIETVQEGSSDDQTAQEQQDESSEADAQDAAQEDATAQNSDAAAIEETDAEAEESDVEESDVEEADSTTATATTAIEEVESTDAEKSDQASETQSLTAQGGPGSSSNVTWSGATTITSATTTTGKTYKSTTANQNAVLINTSGAVKLVNPTVTKSGGTSAGDETSFYGINSAVMCKGGGTTTITGATVTTSAAGANGVFSYGGNASTNATSGDGTTVVISNSKITTTGDGSGGIMTTGYGTTKATNLTINTSGASSAAIRSDRGGGIVTVNGGTYKTTGTGSPAIYATATITATGATLTSTNSQGVVNEGGNTVVLKNCTVNAANKTLNSQDKFRNGIFLYQSMSGDASDGASVFKMTGGTLNNTYGHVFHVTNTSAAITLNGVTINNKDSEGVLLSVCDDAWSGLSNVATVNATNQTLNGKFLVGSDSTLKLNLSGTSTWTGTTSGSITSHKNSSTVSSSLGKVAVTLADTATIVLSGNTTVSSLSGVGYIDYNGYTLTVGSKKYSSGNIGNVVEITDGSAVTIPTAKSGLVYNGAAQVGVASSKYYTLSGTYKAAKAGTYTAKATLSDSDYAWKDGTTAAKTVRWTIAQRPISDSSVTVSSISNKTYTGSALTPKPTVKYGNTTLVNGTDYTLTYANNKNAGTATITITGKGNFKGSRKVTFKICTTSTFYRTHVQTYGWMGWKSNGALSGTTGKAKRMEALNLKLAYLNVTGGIQYRAHVQTYGWQGWKKDGAMAGTTGKAKRLEAVQIKLYGNVAKQYDVYYRVHVQSVGWMGWAKNGAQAGTAGYARRAEAIQILLVKKGGSAPSNSYGGIASNTTKAFMKR